MTYQERLFSKLEKFGDPSTTFFRCLELKLLKERFGYLFAGKKILDLGCGNGIASSTLFENIVDYGLDINSQALKEAKESNLYKNLILADASEKIPLAEESIDLVFSNCTLEHIKNLKPALGEISRVLKENGFFLFTVPSPLFKEYSVLNQIGLNLLAKIYGRLRDIKVQHYHCYSLEEWGQLLEECGLEISQSYHYFDKKTLESWDFLLLLHYPHRFLRKLNKKITDWLWRSFFRERILQKFNQVKMATDKDGAAICVLAKKSSKPKNDKNRVIF